jgi:hypothetical protein
MQYVKYYRYMSELLAANQQIRLILNNVKFVT